MSSPPIYNARLRDELFAMRADDERVRAQLASDGSLFEGYHQRMAEVHRRNAERLSEILDEYGWPGKSSVGEDGAEAAWIIAQHAIGDPALQRRCLPLLEEAARRDEAPAWQFAHLADRVRVLEGRPQIYGTSFDWDEMGAMSPCEIEDPEHVDERRQSVGLPPLAESARRHREAVAETDEHPPADWHARQKEMDEWAHSVGWRR